MLLCSHDFFHRILNHKLFYSPVHICSHSCNNEMPFVCVMVHLVLRQSTAGAINNWNAQGVFF